MFFFSFEDARNNISPNRQIIWLWVLLKVRIVKQIWAKNLSMVDQKLQQHHLHHVVYCTHGQASTSSTSSSLSSCSFSSSQCWILCTQARASPAGSPSLGCTTRTGCKRGDFHAIWNANADALLQCTTRTGCEVKLCFHTTLHADTPFQLQLKQCTTRTGCKKGDFHAILHANADAWLQLIVNETMRSTYRL